MPIQYNTAQLRDKMTVGFSLSELKNDIIFDHFEDLYPDVDGITSTREVIQYLLSYCKRHDAFSKLIKLLKEQRPHIFSDEVDHVDSLLQLEGILDSKRVEYTFELEEAKKDLESVINAIDEIRNEKKDISKYSGDTIYSVEKRLPHIEMRYDSLVATREEKKRLILRLSKSLSDIDRQLDILRKLTAHLSR